jgi:hypothetical protein
MFCTPAFASASALNAAIAIGTSCSDCSRFCAVTTISSSAPCSSCALALTAQPALSAATTAASARRRRLEMDRNSWAKRIRISWIWGAQAQRGLTVCAGIGTAFRKTRHLLFIS